MVREVDPSLYGAGIEIYTIRGLDRAKVGNWKEDGFVT